MALSGTQWHSVALSGNQWQSVAISGPYLLMTCLERIANEMDVVGSCREGRRPERDKPLVHTTARLAIGECEEVGPRPPEEELKSDPPEEIAARKYFSQRLDLPRAWTWHLMTEAIKTSSEVIRGHQRSSEVIRPSTHAWASSWASHLGRIGLAITCPRRREASGRELLFLIRKLLLLGLK